MILHLKAPNDRNGSPRRIWMQMAGHEIKDGKAFFRPLLRPAVVDEGYTGMPEFIRKMIRECALDVTVMEIAPKEYKRILKDKINFNPVAE